MKLSDNTLAILKNFSTINTGLVLKPGHKQSTISMSNTILAEVELTEDFPVEFGIYDLPNFISNFNHFKEGEIEFTPEVATMNFQESFMKYFGAESSLIKQVTKALPEKQTIAEFTLPNVLFDRIKSIASLNAFDLLTFKGKSGKVSVQASMSDMSKDKNNSATFEVGEFSGPDFSIDFKIENLKMLPLDYKVLVKEIFSKFTSKDEKINYYVVMTPPTGA